MTDETNRDRITVRDLAQHPILAEFRKETRHRLARLEPAVEQLRRDVDALRDGRAEHRSVVDHQIETLAEEVRRLRDAKSKEDDGPIKFVIKSWQMPVLILFMILLALTMDPTRLAALLQALGMVQ